MTQGRERKQKNGSTGGGLKRPENMKLRLPISSCRSFLRLKKGEGDWLFVSALETEEFFRHPDISSYSSMQEGAKKAGKWEEVREAAIRYLKNGKLPASKGKNKEKASILPGGVLPKTGLLEKELLKKIKTPVFDLLIKIAIQEEDPQEVIHWYEELKKAEKNPRDTGIQSPKAKLQIR